MSIWTKDIWLNSTWSWPGLMRPCPLNPSLLGVLSCLIWPFSLPPIPSWCNLPSISVAPLLIGQTGFKNRTLRRAQGSAFAQSLHNQHEMKKSEREGAWLTSGAMSVPSVGSQKNWLCSVLSRGDAEMNPSALQLPWPTLQAPGIFVLDSSQAQNLPSPCSLYSSLHGGAIWEDTHRMEAFHHPSNALQGTARTNSCLAPAEPCTEDCATCCCLHSGWKRKLSSGRSGGKGPKITVLWRAEGLSLSLSLLPSCFSFPRGLRHWDTCS